MAQRSTWISKIAKKMELEMRRLGMIGSKYNLIGVRRRKIVHELDFKREKMS